MSLFSSITGGLGNLTSALSPAFDMAGGLMANASSAKEAQKNRDWQEYMSSTSHQRETADLKKAGLNPILSANGGAAMGSGATAQISNPFAGASQNVQSAVRYNQVERQRAQTETALMKQDIRLKGAQERNYDSSTDVNSTSAELNRLSASLQPYKERAASIANFSAVEQWKNIIQNTRTSAAQELSALATAKAQENLAHLHSANAALANLDAYSIHRVPNRFVQFGMNLSPPWKRNGRSGTAEFWDWVSTPESIRSKRR